MKIIISFFVFLHTLSAFALTPSCFGEISTRGEVKIRLYSPQSNVVRQVVILPPTGGENRADRNLARELCQRGHLVKVVDYPQFTIHPDDFDGHERATTNTLKALSGFFEKESTPTTVIGASLGGIYASLVHSLAKSPKWESFSVVDSLVTTVAGGSLAEVLTYSQLDHVKKTRDGRLAGGRFRSLPEYQEFLAGFITTDLLKLAMPGGKVLAFISNKDKIVPTRTQVALAEAHGTKPVRISRLGHSGTVAYVYFRKVAQIHGFLTKL